MRAGRGLLRAGREGAGAALPTGHRRLWGCEAPPVGLCAVRGCRLPEIPARRVPLGRSRPRELSPAGPGLPQEPLPRFEVGSGAGVCLQQLLEPPRVLSL